MELKEAAENTNGEQTKPQLKSSMTDSRLVQEIQTIMGNTSISNELKSLLIESTINHYQSKSENNTGSANWQ